MSAHPSSSTIKLLISTDNHLGFLESDPVRANDSFNTFEEILQLAIENQVDALLLGGDLFHMNKPSHKTIYKTAQLLRKYCYGQGNVKIKIVSEMKGAFAGYSIYTNDLVLVRRLRRCLDRKAQIIMIAISTLAYPYSRYMEIMTIPQA